MTVTAPLRPDAQELVRALLRSIGEDPEREGLRDTPARVVRSLLEMTEGYTQDPREILARVFQEPTEDMVVVRDIPFWSLCEHHMLPFQGTATVAYLPGDHVVGLSKIARLVHCLSRRLQIQERMTREIADAIDAHLAPKGVAVLVASEHTCMRMRGARSEGTMITSAYRGKLRDAGARREFLVHARTA